MNEVLDNIMSRRSVREYSDKPIPKEILQKIIEAGNMAPTGSNVQPWRFVVVEGQAERKKLAELNLTVYKEWIKNAPTVLQEMRKERDAMMADPIYYGAPVYVFVVGTPGMTAPNDCPMVCENIMLAARSFGIGSCWVFFGQLALGDPYMQGLLELKEGEKVFGPVILGYPKDGFPPSPEKKKQVVKTV
ncbi:MAG: nitroreductase family protein [Candidatus Margulisiibacteriota bacterium]